MYAMLQSYGLPATLTPFLPQVLRQYMEEGRPLEAAFSRARSFSRKLKRAGGEFVPRGMTKTQYQDQEMPGEPQAPTAA